MKVIKKSQVIIVVISLLLIAIGYLNYSNNGKEAENTVIGDVQNYSEGMGDAKLVSSNDVEEMTEENLSDGTEETVNIGENEIIEDDYFASSRLERNNIYSETLEIYQAMLENSTITNEQKAIAQEEINKITNTRNAILVAENLIKIKGFDDVVVFENNGSVSVIIKGENLQSDQIAQIQNIVSRELSVETQNITITTKK